MNDDELRTALRRLVEDEEKDPRWQALQSGDLDESKLEDGGDVRLLHQLRQQHRPIPPAEAEALTGLVLGALAGQATAQRAGRGAAAPIIALDPARRRRRQLLAQIGGALMAAGLLLFVTYQVEHGGRHASLPAYRVSVAGEADSAFRRADEPGPLRLSLGVESRVFLRPEQRVTEAVTAQAFLRALAPGAQAVQRPAQRVSPGAAGNLHLFMTPDPATTFAGRWELLVFIGAADQLPGDAEAALQAAERGGDGGPRLLRQVVEIQ